MGDDPKRIILARRARFVAAALASIAATTTAIGASTEACGGDTEQGDGGQSDEGGPKPCLSAPAHEDANTPAVCLSIAPDASIDANPDAADANPHPCLRVAPDSG